MNRIDRCLASLILCCAVLLFTHCGGTAVSAPPPAAVPPPSVASLAPANATANGPQFTLTVNGSNFLSGATILWNGTALTTTLVSGSQVTAPVPAANLTAAGTFQVTVSNPAQSGAPAVSNAVSFTVNNAVPQVTGLSPAGAIAGGVSYTLTVNGANFAAGAIVQVNGANRTTTVVNTTQLTTSIPASDIAVAGNLQIAVLNPAPGGGASAALGLPVLNPVPAITSLSPTSAPLSAGAFTLTINGTGFMNGSVAQWNGAPRTTTFVNSTQVTAAILAGDSAVAAPAQVTVVNPAPGGGPSSATAFNILNPAPLISGLTPSVATAGTAGFTLTVDGTNFVAGSVVNWSGVPRTTTFVSSVRITASISAGDITSAGNPQVTVVNPAPGGGTSPAATFAVITPNPIPSLTTLAPTSAAAGAAGFTLTVNGSSFVAGATVLWNGSARVTSYAGSTQLTATILAADIASASTAQVTVSNPAPGGGISGSLPFTIQPATPPAAVILRASLDSGGAEGNGVVAAIDVSGSGRWVAFVSSAPNWVAGDAPFTPDVFLRDTCLGAPAGCVPATTLISTSPAGLVGNRPSDTPAISSDGRYIAFASAAFNFTSDTVLGQEIFLRDTCVGAPAGCVPSTAVISKPFSGVLPHTGGTTNSYAPTISRDGRYVAFASDDNDLVAADANGNSPDVFVRDTCNGASGGCTPMTTLVSLPAIAQATFFTSPHGVISPDGRYVAFISLGIASPAASLAGHGYYLRDTCNSAPVGCTPTTFAVSLSSTGALADNQGVPSIGVRDRRLAVSYGGRFVLFNSIATNLVPNDTNGQEDQFVRDTCIGAPAGCTPTTVRINLDSNGNQVTFPGTGNRVSISADGRLALFGTSDAATVPQPDTNTAGDIYVRDTCFTAAAGCVPSTVRVSNLASGTAGNGDSSAGILTGSGGYVVFVSTASNFLPGDTNGLNDVYLAGTSFAANPLFAQIDQLKNTFLASLSTKHRPDEQPRPGIRPRRDDRESWEVVRREYLRR